MDSVVPHVNNCICGICHICFAGGILADPYETVVPAAAFPTPTIDKLRHMTLHDVHCGRYRDVMFWDWMRQHDLMNIDVPL